MLYNSTELTTDDNDDDNRDKDDDKTIEEERIVEAGDYNLGDDIGKRIDKGHNSDTDAI